MKEAFEAFNYSRFGLFRANDAYNMLRDHQFDYSVIKDEESKDKGQKKSEDKILTEPEKWVKDKGRMGKIADRVFSPSLSKILTLLSIPLMILFAPGIIGIIGAIVALLMLGYNTTREVMSYRKLRDLKEERGLLEAIKHYRDLNHEHNKSLDITKDFDKTPAKASILSNAQPQVQNKGDNNASSVNSTQNQTPQGVKLKKPFLPAVIGRAVMRRAPESSVAIAAAAISGNPIALGLAVGGAVTGFGAAASQSVAYEKKKYELIQHNQKIAAELKFPYNPQRAGRHNDELIGWLNKERNEFVRNHPQLVKSGVIQDQKIVRAQHPSFLSDAIRVFKDGFSWSKNCRNFTPLINDYGSTYLPRAEMSRAISKEKSVAKTLEPKKYYAANIKRKSNTTSVSSPAA